MPQGVWLAFSFLISTSRLGRLTVPLEARVISGLAVALAIAYWMTPLVIHVADRFKFYDKPVGYKGHTSPTPYLGGTAVMAGFVAAVLLFASGETWSLPVLGGVLLLLVVGTVDDRRTVTWWLRVIVELGLATVLWGVDLGWDLGFGGGVDLLVTMVWTVAVVNAFNLFDNMDGQAATMGVVTSVGLVAFSLATHNTWLAVAAAALAGACAGFLPHNLLTQPARIFLGDGGSMPLGFAVAALTMTATTGATKGLSALVLGTLLVGIPALDTTLVVVSRRRRGISVLVGGQDHLTHRARRRLRTAIAVALALGSAQIILSLLALAASSGSTTALAVTAGLFLMGLGGAVAVIDNKLPATDTAPATPAVADRLIPWLPWQAPFLVVIGVGTAISPFFGGYYESRVWAPMGLGVIVVLLALGIAGALRLRLLATLALGALAALGLWALASSLWADSIEQAVVAGNRTLMLAATLALIVVLVRDRRTALWALGAFAGAATVVVLVNVVQLLGADAPGQFLGGRLNKPLGYINAQATYALIAFWPLMALAEQRRVPPAAGAGLAGAVLCGGLALMSESRGAGLALLGSAVLVFALCPGRLRRAVAFVTVGAAVLAVSSSVLDIYTSRAAGVLPPAGVIHHATVSLVLASLIAGAVWGLLSAFERGLAGDAVRTARGIVAALLSAAALVVVGVGVVSADRVGHEIRGQYNAFVHLTAGQGGEATASRLLSGAGNRYDYWRIAVDTWQTRPLLGVGAGNYDEPYFLRRATSEDVRQPHSFVLQQLVELGLPGLLLALTFLLTIVIAAARWGPEARRSRTERLLLVSALGAFSAWAVHTQVDWMHLLPGVTGAALIGAAVLLRSRPDDEDRPARAPAPMHRRALLGAAVMLPVAVACVSLSRQTLAESYLANAQEALRGGDASGAITEANRALRLDAENLDTYYVKAAAFARQDAAPLAAASLQEAVRREPGDFLTYALLGDLAVRRGRYSSARRYYREALMRNPNEPSLRQLAQDPRGALR